MASLLTACLSFCFLLVTGSVNTSQWMDCDVKPSTKDGAYGHQFISMMSNETQLFVQYPTGTLPQGQSGWPVLIFMHALNLGYEWYQPHMERLASHGIVTVFPFIKSQYEDDQVNPAVDDTTGKNLEEALDAVRKGALQNIKVDSANIAFAGHNMGAVSAIRVASKQPKGTAKVLIAMHPFVCNFGPPPYPITVSSAEIKQANDNVDLIYTTSENDNAFGPWTPAREKSCFGHAAGSAIFVNFRSSACDAYPDCKDIPANGFYGSIECKKKFHPFGKGHFCPTAAPGVSKWVSPEAQWLTTAARMYLQHGADPDSKCRELLWKSSDASLSNDPNVADKVLQLKSESTMSVLV